MSFLLALACADPFLNDPPRLDAVNGVQVERRGRDAWVPDGEPSLEVVPGEPFTIELVISDPDGDAVDAWWPRSPAGWEFDPDSAVGRWDVPDGAIVVPLELILRDDHPENPRSAGYWVPVWAEGQ